MAIGWFLEQPVADEVRAGEEPEDLDADAGVGRTQRGAIMKEDRCTVRVLLAAILGVLVGWMLRGEPVRASMGEWHMAVVQEGPIVYRYNTNVDMQRSTAISGLWRCDSIAPGQVFVR